MQPSEWCAGGSYFDWQGHRMFCRVEGTGEPLLVIHGFPTASWDWWKLWPALTATYRCYAVDMLGYGYSAKPRDAEYSILRQADLQEALLAREGVTSYRMLAHDYGLSVALELLARGAKVRGTCMLNGGLFPEAHRPVLTQKLLASPIGPLIARLSSYRTFAKTMRGIWGKRPLPDEEIRGMWELISVDKGMRVMPKLIGYLAERRKYRDRWVGALVKATPLRLIDGLLDPVAGAQIVKRFRELVPNPDVIELPDIGHYPQIEAPELVEPAVLEFFARC
jgi:pimeloyl-ACP methyl ester carboxylesterase